MSTPDRIVALRSVRADVVNYCRELSQHQWDLDSTAPGWRIRDVVAHMGASCRVLASPKAIGVLTSKDSEADNEILVDERRSWPVERVLAEFESWSKFAIAVMSVGTRGLAGAIKVPFGTLGSYPIRILPSTLVFDWHTHLHHDIAPAVGKPAPPVNDRQLEATVEWMLAGIEQMNRPEMGWVDRPLGLELTGPGGGCWHISPGGDGLLTVTTAGPSQPAASITGTTCDFPRWATTRVPWRSAGLTIVGDEDYAARFLDNLNVI